MSDLPEMTAIAIREPGGPEVLAPQRGRGRSPARANCWSRWRPRASTGPTSCSARAIIRRRRAPPIFRASRLPARSSRSAKASQALEARRPGLGAGDRRRLCGYCVAHETHALPVPTVFRWSKPRRCPKPSSPSGTMSSSAADSSRRNAAGPWRLVRHRHGRDPAGQGLRRAGYRDRRRPRNARPAAARRRHCHQLQDRGLRRRHRRPRPQAGVDVILDMVGGDYIERNYELAAVEGRIVQIAFQGSPWPTVDFRLMLTSA